MNSTEQYEMRKLFRQFTKLQYPWLFKDGYSPTLQEILTQTKDPHLATAIQNWYTLTHRPTPQKDIFNP